MNNKYVKGLKYNISKLENEIQEGSKEQERKRKIEEKQKQISELDSKKTDSLSRRQEINIMRKRNCRN